MADPVLFPAPGEGNDTPVREEILDHASFVEWVDGVETTPSVKAEDLLWTRGDDKIGMTGLKFGKAKVLGPRSLRIGFTEAIPVGTVLVRGNVRVSALKASEGYPGEPGDDSQWIEGQRLMEVWMPPGEVPGDPDGEEYSLWIFPPEFTTRALRFQRVAQPTDTDFYGWLKGALVMRERV
ncbi:MAG: hypothetical protein ACQKBT_02300, partial [Puniceicoccales bacterium]